MRNGPFAAHFSSTCFGRELALVFIDVPGEDISNRKGFRVPYCFTVSTQGYLSVWDVSDCDADKNVDDDEQGMSDDGDSSNENDQGDISSKNDGEAEADAGYKGPSEAKYVHDHRKIGNLQLGSFANLLQNDVKYGSRRATASGHEDSKNIVRCTMVIGLGSLLEHRGGWTGELVTRVPLDTPFFLFLGLEDGRGIVLELNLSFSEFVSLFLSNTGCAKTAYFFRECIVVGYPSKLSLSLSPPLSSSLMVFLSHHIIECRRDKEQPEPRGRCDSDRPPQRIIIGIKPVKTRTLCSQQPRLSLISSSGTKNVLRGG